MLAPPPARLRAFLSRVAAAAKGLSEGRAREGRLWVERALAALRRAGVDVDGASAMDGAPLRVFFEALLTATTAAVAASRDREASGGASSFADGDSRSGAPTDGDAALCAAMHDVTAAATESAATAAAAAAAATAPRAAPPRFPPGTGVLVTWRGCPYKARVLAVVDDGDSIDVQWLRKSGAPWDWSTPPVAVADVVRPLSEAEISNVAVGTGGLDEVKILRLSASDESIRNPTETVRHDHLH